MTHWLYNLNTHTHTHAHLCRDKLGEEEETGQSREGKEKKGGGRVLGALEDWFGENSRNMLADQKVLEQTVRGRSDV